MLVSHGYNQYNVLRHAEDVLQGTAYATQGGLVRVAGYKESGAFTSTATIADTTAAGAVTQDVGKPTYDIGGIACTNQEKYQTKFFKFEETRAAANSPATYQLQINSSSIPQFKANEVEMYTISKNSVDNYDTEHCMTLDQYRNNYFVQCVRFCMPDSDFGRMISGLDTRSVSAACSLVTEGLANTTRLDVFCECHSSLRIGPGKAIEVVV